MMWRLQDALPYLSGAQLVGAGETCFARVHSDTRTTQAGDLFVALKGERFDAHNYLSQAKATGASALLAEHGIVQAGMNGILVPDTLLALGQLAKAWRQRFTPALAVVVGSNGKTTTTQMVATIVRIYNAAEAYATQGNLNNPIGVPLTLLGLCSQHQRAVLELGMNHPGEIAYLSDLALPTVAVITNAQREHLEFMRSVSAVAQENGSVIASLPATGRVILPWDDEYTPIWRKLAAARPVTVFAQCTQEALPSIKEQIQRQGLSYVLGHATWRKGVWQVQAHTIQGQGVFSLRLAGRHNLRNALAALATGLALGVPLAHACQALTSFSALSGRCATHVLQGNKTLIDDSYNANPDSVRAAIDVLADLPAPRLLILGDMGEVGGKGPALHAEVGAYAGAQGIDSLLTYGTLTKQTALAFAPWPARHLPDEKSLLKEATTQTQVASSILVKGSRFMRMERVVQALQTAFAPSTATVEATTSVLVSTSALTEGED